MRALLFILVCLAVISCKKDPCPDFVCQNDGKAFECACTCDPGFEGEFCEIKSANNYSGLYKGTYNCAYPDGSLESESIDFTISPSATEDAKIYLTLDGAIIEAIVNKEAFTIPEQDAELIGEAEKQKIYKSIGSLKNDQIEFVLEYLAEQEIVKCNFIAEKQ